MSSDVARLKQQMEDEARAAYNALHGMSCGIAKHSFITARMERMGQLHEQLKLIASEDEANQFLRDALEIAQ